jgi:hypothetical protein
MEELYSLKTRQLILQNLDGTFPPIQSVLGVSDTRGRIAPTSDLNLSSVRTDTLQCNYADIDLIHIHSTTLTNKDGTYPTKDSVLTVVDNLGNIVAKEQSSVVHENGAIAIGHKEGIINQGPNSIVLNASESVIDVAEMEGLYIAPVRGPIQIPKLGGQWVPLYYNTETGEIAYGS